MNNQQPRIRICDANRSEKRSYALFRRVLAHIQLALSVITLVCFVIDRFNNAMEFMNSDLTKWIVAILCTSTIATSIMTIVAYWPIIKESK